MLPADLMDYFDTYATGHQPYKGGAWCYEDGCIYRGLQMLHEATGDPRWLAHLERLAGAQVGPDGSLKGYTIGEYNIDNILSGRVLFHLDRQTGDPRWRKAADLLATQLASHPRTSGGSYWHKKIYPHQVWLDGLYMGLPFQVEYGQVTGNDALVADALAQLSEALVLTDRSPGLYAHGYDEAREQAWADPATGRSAAAWGRALGWLAMALVDVADLLGPDGARAAGVDAQVAALLGRIVPLQAADGGWLQVIELPDLPGNYTETSGTAMFCYVLLRATRLGHFDGMQAADRALAFLRGRMENGALTGICHVAGLGGFSGVYRDGSPEYYLTEAIVSDDPKATGPLMMAGAELARARQLQPAA